MQQDHGRAIFRRSPQVSLKCSNHLLIFSGLLENSENSFHEFSFFTNFSSARMNWCFGGNGEALDSRFSGDFVAGIWLTFFGCTIFSFSVVIVLQLQRGE